MKILEAQKKVDNWIKEYGVRYFNELTNTALLMEEIGELSRHIARKYGEQNYKKECDSKKLIEEEMGDVFFVLLCLCNQMNIDLTQSIINSIEKKTKRDNKRHFLNKNL